MTTRNRFAIAKLTMECMARFPGSMLVADLFAQKDRLQIEATLGYDGLAPVEPFEDLGPILAPLADLDHALSVLFLAGLHENHGFSPRVLDGRKGNGQSLSSLLDGNPHIGEHLELQPPFRVRNHAPDLGGAGGGIEEVAYVGDVADEDLGRIGSDGDEALPARLHAPDVLLVEIPQDPDVRSVDESEERLVPIDQLAR